MTISGKSYDKNPVSVKSITVVETVPASGETITIFYNGLKQGVYKSNNDGKFTFKIDGEGVYELISFSDEYGLALSKSILVN